MSKSQQSRDRFGAARQDHRLGLMGRKPFVAPVFLEYFGREGHFAGRQKARESLELAFNT